MGDADMYGFATIMGLAATRISAAMLLVFG